MARRPTTLYSYDEFFMTKKFEEDIAVRVEAIASRLEAIAIRNIFHFHFPCAASAVKRAASQFEFMSIQRVHSQGHVSRAHTH